MKDNYTITMPNDAEITRLKNENKELSKELSIMDKANYRCSQRCLGHIEDNTRLTNENHRLRAALVAADIELLIDPDSSNEFDNAIEELKYVLSGDGRNKAMAFIAKFNHDKINIDEVE